MKIVSKDGRTWVEKKQDGKISVGFTRALLDELGECWSILPAASAKVEVKEGQPFCSVETNDGVFCVKSPVKGLISFFSPEAVNFPDRLTEEQAIATMREKTEQDDFVEVPEAPAQGLARPLFNLDREALNQQLADLQAIGGARGVNARNAPNLDPTMGPVRLDDVHDAHRDGRLNLAEARRRWADAQARGVGIR